MEKKSKHLSVDDQARFMSQLNVLSNIPPPLVPSQEFQHLEDMFMAEWTGPAPLLIDHYRSEWSRSGGKAHWRHSRAHSESGTARSNNALEATNKHMKGQRLVDHKAMAILPFCKKLREFLHNHSLRRIPGDVNEKVWASQRTLRAEDFQAAKRYALQAFNGRSNQQMWLVDTANVGVPGIPIGFVIYVAALRKLDWTLSHDRCLRKLKAFLTDDYATFSEYAAISHSLCFIWRDLSRREGYACSCYENGRDNTCKHSLGVSLHRGTIAIPAAWNVDPIQAGKKVGRKKRILPALQYEPIQAEDPVHVLQGPQQQGQGADAVANPI